MGRRTRIKTDSQKANAEWLVLKDVLVEETDIEIDNIRDPQNVGSQTQKSFEVRDLFTRSKE